MFLLDGPFALLIDARKRVVTDSIFPRVWMGSIVGCGKLVKKKSTRNHKMFRSSCRKRLLVVLSAPIAANSTLKISRYRKSSAPVKSFGFSYFLSRRNPSLEAILRYVGP